MTDKILKPFVFLGDVSIDLKKFNYIYLQVVSKYKLEEIVDKIKAIYIMDFDGESFSEVQKKLYQIIWEYDLIEDYFWDIDCYSKNGWRGLSFLDKKLIFINLYKIKDEANYWCKNISEIRKKPVYNFSDYEIFNGDVEDCSNAVFWNTLFHEIMHIQQYISDPFSKGTCDKATIYSSDIFYSTIYGMDYKVVNV